MFYLQLDAVLHGVGENAAFYSVGDFCSIRSVTYPNQKHIAFCVERSQLHWPDHSWRFSTQVWSFQPSRTLHYGYCRRNALYAWRPQCRKHPHFLGILRNILWWRYNPTMLTCSPSFLTSIFSFLFAQNSHIAPRSYSWYAAIQ